MQAGGSEGAPKEWKTISLKVHNILCCCQIMMSKQHSNSVRSFMFCLEFLQHKLQLSNWECGYYVMLFVEKIVLLHGGVDVYAVSSFHLTSFNDLEAFQSLRILSCLISFLKKQHKLQKTHSCFPLFAL